MLDVVWLKRDVRLHDHGPFAEISRSSKPFLILYMYEPDQLSEPTVHGSHLRFIHEGLIDLDNRFNVEFGHDGNNKEVQEKKAKSRSASFKALTICHSNAIATLNAIHENCNFCVGRLLAHQETGHWQSYMRDKAVRKWCRSRNIPFIEYNQNGVTRCLKSRDDYSKKFKAFMSMQPYATLYITSGLLERLVVLPDLPGFMSTDFESHLNEMSEIAVEQRLDLPDRQQQGGETKALSTLKSFLQDRGSNFSSNISSPNTAWTSCSRLSPYLSWGNISLRMVFNRLSERQEQLRTLKKQGGDIGNWLKSLQAFSSRIHWRSHFIQKLETEPMMEKRDLCPAYQPLRRQDGDWNSKHYEAWKDGVTGFPFVDACMRCLSKHGWLNFRMRAMLVSFATYNLWLDWKGIAPHLARHFLDYEPGIHYPQLQMQAGCTGINAMRVYSVTKQGKDQDPSGTFIRKYVPELFRVPDKYIHEPWKMPASEQIKCETLIITYIEKESSSTARVNADGSSWNTYPEPIVDEKETAKIAKSKIAGIRKLESTKVMANQVFQKHGSRSRRDGDEMKGKPSKVGSSGVEEQAQKKPGKQQPRICSYFSGSKCSDNGKTVMITATKSSRHKHPSIVGNDAVEEGQISDQDVAKTPSFPKKRAKKKDNSSCWACHVCTFLNDKPLGLACSICGEPRKIC